MSELALILGSIVIFGLGLIVLGFVVLDALRYSRVRQELRRKR